MHVDTPTPPNPEHSHFNIQMSSIPLELKRKVCEMTLTRQHLHEIWGSRDTFAAQLLGVRDLGFERIPTIQQKQDDRRSSRAGESSRGRCFRAIRPSK